MRRLGGRPGVAITAPEARTDRTILYLHGGGFRLGSLESHRDLMARLSAASGCRVVGLDYRLAPESRFPAPLEDARAAFDELQAEAGSAGQIALAGDSAGGGLALSLLLDLRDAGRARPAAAVLMSPWTDLAASGETYVSRSASDPIHQRPMILALAEGYLGPDGDPLDPRASPLHGDLSDLPPLLVQVGDRETVLDDSRALAAKVREAGGEVRLEIEDGMIHVFQAFARDLPVARDALVRAGRFLRDRMNA